MVALNNETEWNIARQGHVEPGKVVSGDENTADLVGKAFGVSSCDCSVQSFIHVALVVDAEIGNDLICVQLVNSQGDGFPAAVPQVRRT